MECNRMGGYTCGEDMGHQPLREPMPKKEAKLGEDQESMGREGGGDRREVGHRLPKGLMPHVLTTCTSLRHVTSHYVTSHHVMYAPPPPLPHVTEGCVGGEDTGHCPLWGDDASRPHPSPLTTPLR